MKKSGKKIKKTKNHPVNIHVFFIYESLLSNVNMYEVFNFLKNRAAQGEAPQVEGWKTQSQNGGGLWCFRKFNHWNLLGAQYIFYWEEICFNADWMYDEIHFHIAWIWSKWKLNLFWSCLHITGNIVNTRMLDGFKGAVNRWLLSWVCFSVFRGAGACGIA